METTIRTFNSEDYYNVIRLWKKAGLKLSLSDCKQEIDRFASFNADSFFILELDGELIGTVIGAFDGRRGYIHHLAVDPEYQQNGHGKRLMDHVTDYYRKRNVVKIHLMIERDNADIVSFYKKLGWFVRDDLIMMSKNLRSSSFKIEEDRVVIEEESGDNN